MDPVGSHRVTVGSAAVRVSEVSPGPIFADDGPRGARLIRRVRGIAIEVLAFLVLTVLLPVALVVALLVDLVLWLRRRKPFMAVRLVLMAWWFLLGELRGILTLGWLYVASAGRDTPRRRRGVYNLRIGWASQHLAGIRVLFGLRFELEGLDEAGPGPVVVLIRHASIVDNMLGDAVLARLNTMVSASRVSSSPAVCAITYTGTSAPTAGIILVDSIHISRSRVRRARKNAIE
jgi:hypothetical protein